MKCLAIICVFFAVGSFAANSELDDEWADFKQRYGKEYSFEEELNRREIFESHMAFIETHNFEAANGLHTFTVGLNEYADLSNDEFVSIMNGFRVYVEPQAFEPIDTSDLPTSVDWNKEGWVTPIKDQGMCGSCWIFSATQALEGAHFNASGKLVSISEQQVLDCITVDYGCGGGWPIDALTYIAQNNGDDTEASYPYQAVQGPKCLFDPANVGATLTSYQNVTSGSESALQGAVANVGPISVGIDASHTSFQLYKSGVYYEPECSSVALDHGVLAYGYGTTSDGQDFWMVKNQWGTSWGNEGFINMARNKDNNCGIATFAAFPIV